MLLMNNVNNGKEKQVSNFCSKSSLTHNFCIFYSLLKKIERGLLTFIT